MAKSHLLTIRGMNAALDYRTHGEAVAAAAQDAQRRGEAAPTFRKDDKAGVWIGGAGDRYVIAAQA